MHTVQKAMRILFSPLLFLSSSQNPKCRVYLSPCREKDKFVMKRFFINGIHLHENFLFQSLWETYYKTNLRMGRL